MVLLGYPSVNKGNKKEVSPMVKIALIESMGSEVWVLGKYRENRIDHGMESRQVDHRGRASQFSHYSCSRAEIGTLEIWNLKRIKKVERSLIFKRAGTEASN